MELFSPSNSLEFGFCKKIVIDFFLIVYQSVQKGQGIIERRERERERERTGEREREKGERRKELNAKDFNQLRKALMSQSITNFFN